MDIKQLRISLGLSQSELARQAGVNRTVLSRVERGERAPSPGLLAALAKVLPSNELGPPRVRSRLLVAKDRRWVRYAFHLHRPVLVQPLRVAFKLARFSPLGSALVDWLDGQHFSGAIWTAIKLLAGRMNGPEQMLFLHGMRQGGRISKVQPRDTHFPLPVVDFPGDQPLAVIVGGCVLFIQVTVVTGGSTPRLDFLLALPGRKPFFVDIEIDGPCHKGSQERDRIRANRLGLPEIRLPCDDLERTDFWEYFWNRVAGLLARHGLRWSQRLGRLRPA